VRYGFQHFVLTRSKSRQSIEPINPIDERDRMSSFDKLID